MFEGTPSFMNTHASMEANLIMWLDQLGEEEDFTARFHAHQSYSVQLNGIKLKDFTALDIDPTQKLTILLTKQEDRESTFCSEEEKTEPSLSNLEIPLHKRPSFDLYQDEETEMELSEPLLNIEAQQLPYKCRKLNPDLPEVRSSHISTEQDSNVHVEEEKQEV